MSEEKNIGLENADSVDNIEDIFADSDESAVIDELGEMYEEKPATMPENSVRYEAPADNVGYGESFDEEYSDEYTDEYAEDYSEEYVSEYEEPEVEELEPPVEEEQLPREEQSIQTERSAYSERSIQIEQPAPQTNVLRVYEKKTEVRTEKKRVSVLSVISVALTAIMLSVICAGAYFGLGALRRIGDEIAANSERLDKLEAEREADYAEVMNVIESEKEEAEKEKADEVTLGKGKILLYDSSVGYTWAPVISGIPLNGYDPNNFTLDDDNRMTYTVDGEESSYFGIDVSAYQKDIDWNAVRADGVEFAILRVGLRGYGEEGNIKKDDYFDYNFKEAHAAGIDLGVYFFSQAITVDEAIEEAECVLKWLDGRKLEYPVVFDWEPAVTLDDDVPRTEDLMPQTLTLSAIAFCETVREAGYDAMIYTNKKLAVLKYDMRQLSCYPVWLASYRPDLTYPYDFDIWQYGLGYVDGIEGEVDFNIAIIK